MPQSLMKATFGCEAFTSCSMLIEGHFFVHPLRDAHLLQDNLCTVEAQDENLSHVLHLSLGTKLFCGIFIVCTFIMLKLGKWSHCWRPK